MRFLIFFAKGINKFYFSSVIYVISSIQSTRLSISFVIQVTSGYFCSGFNSEFTVLVDRLSKSVKLINV